MSKVLVVFCTRSRGTKKMANRIAEGIRMGGDIEVTSEKGQGTAFRLMMPLSINIQSGYGINHAQT